MISKLKDKKQRHNYTDIAKNDSRICNKGERLTIKSQALK